MGRGEKRGGGGGRFRSRNGILSEKKTKQKRKQKYTNKKRNLGHTRKTITSKKGKNTTGNKQEGK